MSREDLERDISIDIGDRELYTVYSEYSSTISGVFFYQNQQIEFRTIAIKVLLGTFGFLGYLYFYNIGLKTTSINILASLLPLLSFFWLLIIMKKDLIYREGLKIGFFDSAIELEKKHSWIPSFHSCLITETDVHHNPGLRQGLFYFVSLAILLLLSLFPIWKNGTLASIRGSLLIAALITLIAGYLATRDIRRLAKLSSQYVKSKIDKNYYKFDKDPKKRIFISMLHTKGREYIEHYSDIKMKYKNLVLFIITALIAGLSYATSIKSESLHVNHIYVVAFIVIMAVIGINLVRYLDLNVSHKQIKHLFELLIKLENEHSFLSPAYDHVKKILYTKKTTPAFQDFMYYCGINLGLIILGAITAYLKLHEDHLIKDILLSFSLFSLLFFWELISYVYLFISFKKNNM